VTEGAIVTAYQVVALATIQQLDPIYVNVTQSTADLQALQKRVEGGHFNNSGSNLNVVQLLLEDRAKYPIEGTLQFRDVSVDPTTASVVLRMVFQNPNEVLLPGMFVRTVVKEGVNEQAILIPQQAVSRDPKGNPLAMVVNGDGKVDLRLLTLDRAIGDQWLVAKGLEAGDRLIAEGAQNVKPGMSVREVPFNDVPKPGEKSQSVAQSTPASNQ
jgi:membrane fusion protein (multidrug efflux system)